MNKNKILLQDKDFKHHIYDDYELIIKDGVIDQIKYYDKEIKDDVKCHISYFNIIIETSDSN